MPWSPVDANLGLFEVLLVSNDVANYGGILPLLQLFFALMGAEGWRIVFSVWISNTNCFFLVICTMLVAIFMQQIQNGLWNCLAAMGFGLRCSFSSWFRTFWN
jgi:putative oxidoreductase